MADKENLVVASKVKETIKSLGMRSGEDYLQSLSNKVHALIEASVAKCKTEGRQTLKSGDV